MSFLSGQDTRIFSSALVLGNLILSGCVQTAEQISVESAAAEIAKLVVSNPLSQPRESALIEVAVAGNDQLVSLLGGDVTLKSDSQALATQWVDRDADGSADHLIALANFSAGETREFSLVVGTVAVDRKVQTDFWLRDRSKKDPEGLTRLTEFQVPADHSAGDKLFKYEGVGWESNKVAYRLYLDKRNVIDIFGKKVSELVLQGVGINGGYHDMADWGMDILKVGNSLGMGGIGALVDGKVERVEETASLAYREIANGPLEATAQISQTGWQVGSVVSDISTRYSIHEGSRMTLVHARLSSSEPQMVTGIVKHPGTELIQSEGQGSWSYIATFGEQSLVPDQLGMAVFYPSAAAERIMGDGKSHVVVFNAGAREINYGFLAAWQQDSSGVDNVAAFRELLERQLAELNQPLLVSGVE